MPDFILSPLLESPLFQQLCDQLLEQPGAAAYEIGEGARAALAARLSAYCCLSNASCSLNCLWLSANSCCHCSSLTMSR